MRLSTLITELQMLESAGYGERRVLDQDGNDVMEVKPPLEPLGDYQPDAEAESVMLVCFIDRHGPGGSSSGGTA